MIMVIINLLLKLVALLLVGASSVYGFINSWQSWKPTKLSNSQKKVVCVIGGGFGGLYSAMYIAAKSDNSTEVLLVEPKQNFAFAPLYYELMVGSAETEEVAPRYEDLLANTKLKHIHGYIDSIDVSHNSCTVATPGTSGEESSTMTVCFDELIVAAGIVPRVDCVEGAKEHALPYYSAENAIKLKEKLESLQATVVGDIQVVVIGGGCGGVEVAANVAEYIGGRACITIVDRNAKLMAASSDFNRRAAERTLQRLGVHMRLGISVHIITAFSVVLADRQTQETSTVPAHIVILTAGTQPTPLVASLNLPKNSQGRILTRSTLQCIENDHIYALGDCAAVQGAEDPATAQVAMQQALTVAHNVLESIRHSRQYDPANTTANKQGDAVAIDSISTANNNTSRTKPVLQDFRFLNLGEMISLGDTNAAMTSLGGWVKVNGPLAAVARRLVYVVRMPTLSQSWVALKSAVSLAWRKRFACN